MKLYSPEELIELAGQEAIDLEKEASIRLAKYIVTLDKWAKRTNLIGPAAQHNFWDDHLAECLIFGKRVIQFTEEEDVRLADIGSGAGLPGLIIGVVKPELQITLIESRRRKASFLEIAAHELGLENVNIEFGRIPDQQQAHLNGKFKIVVSRAADQIEAVVDIAAWLSGPEAKFWFLVGHEGAERAAKHAQRKGFGYKKILERTSKGKSIICAQITKSA